MELDKITNAKIEAMAMLLGEPTVVCSCCLGRRREMRAIFGPRICGQCNGLGYDVLGDKTKAALVELLKGKLNARTDGS